VAQGEDYTQYIALYILFSLDMALSTIAHMQQCKPWSTNQHRNLVSIVIISELRSVDRIIA